MNSDQRRALAIGGTCIVGWSFAFIAINIFRDYAFGLFVWLPTVMGIMATMVEGYKNPRKKERFRNTSFLVLLFFCLGLLTFAWEGIICMVMAAPVGILFTWIGYRIGYIIVKSSLNPNIPTAIVMLAVSVPSLMAFENAVGAKEEIRSITTVIEINASPEQVWGHVIEFPQLNEPTEFVFKTGIAYPQNATITGTGVGAVRHCNFSTGCFVEPITIWNAPTLLKFSVVDQPEPMKELSPFQIHPNHLHGYWISKEGQFKLTKQSNGKTLLEGTTWYLNKIKPDFYWTLWSDFIVHKIHMRVLNHIKVESERN